MLCVRWGGCVWWLGWVMGWVLGLSVIWLGWVFLHLFFGRAVFPSLWLGGAAWPPHSWGGAAFTPSPFCVVHPTFSSFVWPSLLLGGGAFLHFLWVVVRSPAPFGPFFFSGNQPHPKKEAEGSTIKRRRRPSSPTRMGGRGKQHH